MKPEHTPRSVTHVPRRSLCERIVPMRMGLALFASISASLLGCGAIDEENPMNTAAVEEAAPTALTASGSPLPGLISIRSLGYGGTGPNALVCAEWYGESPLVANRQNLGTWEQYILTRDPTDDTYLIQSLAHGKSTDSPDKDIVKYVHEPKDQPGPLMANRPVMDSHFYEPPCYYCHGDPEHAKWYFTNTGTDRYQIASIASNKRWVTQPNGNILLDWISRESSYQILTDRIPGSSANTVGPSGNVWNYIYIAEKPCGQGAGVTYTFKLSQVPWFGTTLKLYIDSVPKGLVRAYAAGVVRIRNVCVEGGYGGYQPHRVQVELTGAGTLSEFGWDTP